jgi:ankyrin repeat protein
MKAFRDAGVAIALTVLLGGAGLFIPSHHDVQQYTPIFAAAEGGDLATVRTAVEANPRLVEETEWGGATLLHDAVRHNHSDVATYLLDKNANVDVKADSGMTALHFAAQNGNIAIVTLLLDNGADINAVDTNGWTPLDRAIKWHHPMTCDFLRARGGHSGSN